MFRCGEIKDIMLQYADFFGATGASIRGCAVWNLENMLLGSTSMQKIILKP